MIRKWARRVESYALVLVAAVLAVLWTWVPAPPRCVVKADFFAGFAADGSVFATTARTADRKKRCGPIQVWNSNGQKQGEWLSSRHTFEQMGFHSDGTLWVV